MLLRGAVFNNQFDRRHAKNLPRQDDVTGGSVLEGGGAIGPLLEGNGTPLKTCALNDPNTKIVNGENC